MDNMIKEFLRNSPGLSAGTILKMYKKNIDHNILPNTIYKSLRKLKSKGIVINKGSRWYLNLK